MATNFVKRLDPDPGVHIKTGSGFDQSGRIRWAHYATRVSLWFNIF